MENLKVKIASRGYTIEVTSWENDADHWDTNKITVLSKEEALKIKKVCQELFISKNDGATGIGNSRDGGYQTRIDEYIKNNPEMDLTSDWITNLADKVLGFSEYYDFRVCDSVTVTYLEEDVYAQKI